MSFTAQGRERLDWDNSLRSPRTTMARDANTFHLDRARDQPTHMPVVRAHLQANIPASKSQHIEDLDDDYADDDDEVRALEEFLVARARRQARRFMAKGDTAGLQVAVESLNIQEIQDHQRTHRPVDSAEAVAVRRTPSTGKYYEGRRLMSSAFSPGYGFRLQTAHEPLPPTDQLIGEDHSYHRVYPAPAPSAATVNQALGWEDDKRNDENTINGKGIACDDEPVDESFDDPASAACGPNTQPFLDPESVDGPTEATKSTYVPWIGGVVYKDPEAPNRLFTEDPYAAARQARMERENAFSDLGNQRGGRIDQPARDSGWERRGGSTTQNHYGGFSSRAQAQNDDAWEDRPAPPLSEVSRGAAQADRSGEWGDEPQAATPIARELSRPTPQDDSSWGDSARAPAPERSVPAIHPDRLKMLGGAPAARTGSAPAVHPDRMKMVSGPPVARHAFSEQPSQDRFGNTPPNAPSDVGLHPFANAPQTESTDEFGGW